MEEIIAHLEESLKDGFLSRNEKKSLRALMEQNELSENDFNYIKSKIYDLAVAKSSPDNYQFIIEWIEKTNHTLYQFQNNSSGVYFSPGVECRNAIIEQLERAQREIKICVFTISDDLISNTILKVHRSGIPIQIISDNDKSYDRGSDIERMAKEGLQIKIDNTSNHMHHKFMIVDEGSLVTGSYNWTRSAARYNHENVLLSRESKVIRSYIEEFNNLWNEMTLY